MLFSCGPHKESLKDEFDTKNNSSILKSLGLTYSHRVFARPKRWAVEVDYFHKLSPKEKAWLIRFQSEFHDGRIKKGDDQALHKSDDDRRDCYQRTNLAMRDTYGIMACCGMLNDNYDLAPDTGIESEIIERIDSQRYPNPGLVARAFIVLDKIIEEWKNNGKYRSENA